MRNNLFMQSMAVSQSSEASVFSFKILSNTLPMARENGRFLMLSRSMMLAMAYGFWFYFIIF